MGEQGAMLGIEDLEMADRHTVMKRAGDVYRAEEVPEASKTLRESIDLFANSEFARDAFGSDIQAHYAHSFRNKQCAYFNAVTDREPARYFERI